MGAKRLEVAHFWQDVCLSISVYPSRRWTSDDESWLDAAHTQIRLRSVEPVAAVPREWGITGWGPFLLIFVSIVGVTIRSPSADVPLRPLRVATILQSFDGSNPHHSVASNP